MNLKSKLAIAAVAAASTFAAQAQSVLTLHSDNGANSAVDGAKVTRLTVADGVLTLWNGETQYMQFDADAAISRLTFDAASSSVKPVLAQAASVGVRGPVRSTLSIYGLGADAKPCTLRVFAANGAQCLKVDGWHGQDVNVAGLAPGVYAVNFNNQSIKFVKQ